MAEVKDKPKDLPSTNALDAIPDPEESEALVSFGSKMLTDPPELRDVVVYLVKAECTAEGRAIRSNDRLVRSRTLKVLGVKRWKPGDTEPPTTGDENQGELFDDDGAINDPDGVDDEVSE